MTKYKHTRLGYIAEPANDAFYAYKMNPRGLSLTIRKDLVENSLDWEAIPNTPKRDWEITAFTGCSKFPHNNVGDIYYRTVEGHFSLQGEGGIGVPEINFSVPSHFKILSVRRLSDGEEFKIGDKVKHNNLKFIIDYFVEHGDTILLKGTHSAMSTCSISIPFWKKILLTTEDGVDLVKGDRVVKLREDGLIEAYRDITHCHSTHNGKFFSSAEKANEYVEKNKVIGVSTDGVNLKAGYTVYALKKDNFEEAAPYMIDDDECFNHTHWYYFSSKEARDEYIQKNKVALVTEDGVSLKKGDKCVKACQLDDAWHMQYHIVGERVTQPDPKFFSTMEKAREYWDKNHVVFTTDDNLPIKKGERYYGIYARDMSYGQILCDGGKMSPGILVKTFADPEKAKEYSLWNKPCLSLREIRNGSDVIHYPPNTYWQVNMEKLIELAKSKQ